MGQKQQLGLISILDYTFTAKTLFLLSSNQILCCRRRFPQANFYSKLSTRVKYSLRCSRRKQDIHLIENPSAPSLAQRSNFQQLLSDDGTCGVDRDSRALPCSQSTVTDTPLVFSFDREKKRSSDWGRMWRGHVLGWGDSRWPIGKPLVWGPLASRKGREGVLGKWTGFTTGQLLFWCEEGAGLRTVRQRSGLHRGEERPDWRIHLSPNNKRPKQGCKHVARSFIRVHAQVKQHKEKWGTRQLREVAATQHGLPHQHPFTHHPQRNRSAKNQLQLTDGAHAQWKPGAIPEAVSKQDRNRFLQNTHLKAFFVFFSNHGPRENSCFVLFFFALQNSWHKHKSNTKVRRGRKKFPFWNVQRLLCSKCPKRVHRVCVCRVLVAQ